MQIALPGSLHRVIVWLCTHSYPAQPRHTMQIALPGSLHRVIMWLCTHSQLSTGTTVEAHDADRHAGLAASCHRVAVHSLTGIQHSRGTRCRSPCRARCIVSLWALFQLSTTCVQSARVCKSPASGAVTSLGASSSADQPFFEKALSTGWHMLQFALAGSLHAVCNLRQFARPQSLGAGTLPLRVVVGARCSPRTRATTSSRLKGLVT